MIKLTCYMQSPLLHVEESALLNSPTNLSFKFDDSLHAKGVGSLDGCQDTKKNPDQISAILLSVREAKYLQDYFVFTYLYLLYSIF